MLASGDASAHRSWTIDANDGIIATAGLLFGFAGAGASNRVLLFTATAATIAGGLSVGGASWAEQAAERDAQLLYAKQESDDLAADPDGELEELARHWEERGLSPETAKEVARQLSEHDALAAQLEWEYSFAEPVPATFPIWFGVGAGLAYVVGALVPLLITYFAPVDVEPWAILGAVTGHLGVVVVAGLADRSADAAPDACEDAHRRRPDDGGELRRRRVAAVMVRPTGERAPKRCGSVAATRSRRCRRAA